MARVTEKYEAVRREIRRMESTGLPPGEKLNAFLESRGTSAVKDGASLISLLRRPQVHYDDLRAFDEGCAAISAEIAEAVEINVKYEGYIQRQMRDIADFARMESRPIPEGIDYDSIQGLRLEAREKLSAIRPASLGQAGRISGVSPADMTALMIYLEK